MGYWGFGRLVLAAAMVFQAVRPAAAAGARLAKALVYNKPGWYVHPDIPKIDAHLKAIGAGNGFQVDVTGNPADFNPAKLAAYQVVILNNISEMGTSVKDASQRAAFRKWIEEGGGLVAFHGSGVVRGTWDWYIDLLGTDWYYDAAMQEARVFIPAEARGLPISSGLPPEAKLTDEWNNFKVNVDTLAGFSVVLAIDESSYDPTRKKHPAEGDNVPGFRMADPGGKWVHPVSWARSAGKGRVFYSCIGHDIQVMSSPFATQHFLRAIQWAAGDLEAPSAIGGGEGAAAGAGGGLSFAGGRMAWAGKGRYVLEVHSVRGRKVLARRGRGPASFDLREGLEPGVYRFRISAAGAPRSGTFTVF